MLHSPCFDARRLSWWAAAVPVRYACAMLRRAALRSGQPGHASTSVGGLSPPAPSFDPTCTAQPVPSAPCPPERPLRSRSARPTTSSST
eukprot:4087034-Prymnesium_polylepis.1